MTINNIVLKVAAPCNLACTYCYEYQAGDESWRTKPKAMRVSTARQLGRRIAEYARANGLTSFRVTCHGGEPLLLSPSKLTALFDTVISETPGISIQWGMQTNATLVTPSFCELFLKYNVQIGVSIDGHKDANRFRIDHQGQSSWDRAIAGYRLLQERCPQNLVGILAVIDTSTDAKEAIDFLCSLKPRQIDLLVPFETHDSLASRQAVWSNALADWFQKAFDAWFGNPVNHGTKIRVFEDALQAELTRSSNTDWFGVKPINYLVVATDGTLELLDHLKVLGSSSDAVRDLGGTVDSISFAKAQSTAEALLRSFGANQLSPVCHACSLHDVCGGGYIPHRFSTQNGFSNPSVACSAIKQLFSIAANIVEREKLADAI